MIRGKSCATRKGLNMRQVKTKKKAFELASEGRLFYIEDGVRYRKANIGLVISSFDKMKFFYKT